MTDMVRIPQDTLVHILNLAAVTEDVSEDELAAMKVGLMAAGLGDQVVPRITDGEEGRLRVRWENLAPPGLMRMETWALTEEDDG